MGDSDADSIALGSDADSDDDEPGFDPASLDKLTDKQRKKWEKNIHNWRIFTDFLFRHIAIVTFRYNCFEHEEMTPFMIALEKAEGLRGQTKLKKGEEPCINSFKVMKETTDLLTNQRYIVEANRIKKFLDIAGRMRGLVMIAGGYYKTLKKGKVKNLDKIKHFLDYWKGFTIRSYDYSQLQLKNADPQSFNALEQRYLVWPTAIRTAINLSQKFLKKTSDSTGLELMSSDPKTQLKHMQAAEFVVAAKIEEMLFNKVVHESKSFLSGLSNPLVQQGNPQSLMNQPKLNHKDWDLPPVDDIDIKMLTPIPDTGLLCDLPADIPKEKKKGKKGKKGGKKGAKGRGLSASSHKGGKKKKRK